MRNSLAVRQFTALCRGEMPLQKPKLIVTVRSVEVMKRLCLHCQVIEDQDLITYSSGRMWSVCRICRHVNENQVMTRLVLMDDGNLMEGER